MAVVRIRHVEERNQQGKLVRVRYFDQGGNPVKGGGGTICVTALVAGSLKMMST